MKVIGLTGSICSGKSTVAGFLAKLGAVVLSADEIGHEAFSPHTETWQRVVEAFGREILTGGNEIDRKKLGEIVFNNSQALERLNQIMHPGMHRVAEKKIEELRQQGVGVVVLEAPLLIEAKWLDLVDEVWVAKASEATMVRRCQNRSGLSEAQAKARILSQLPPGEKTRYADVVIDTDVTLEEVEARVKDLWEQRFCSKG